MQIDIGAPSEYEVSGIIKRIEKLNAIQKIPNGINLDLGTGIGAYYSKIKEQSKSLFALDGEMQYLKGFKSNLPNDSNKIFLSKAENIAIKSDTFDSVFAIEVLEHVENLKSTILEVKRILKPNGLFYITVPNKYFPLENHMVEFGRYAVKGKYVPFLSMFDTIHKIIGTSRRFGEKDFNEIAKIGFEVVGFKYMMPPFDYFKFGNKYLKKITNKLENSFFRIFSMTLIVVLKKTD